MVLLGHLPSPWTTNTGQGNGLPQLARSGWVSHSPLQPEDSVANSPIGFPRDR